MNTSKQLLVRLGFRGFSFEPELLISEIGVVPDSKGVAGDPVKPGVRGRLRESVAIYKRSFGPDTQLEMAVRALMDELGGLDRLSLISNRLQIKHIEWDVILPVRNSDRQYSTFLPLELLQDLAAMRSSIGFEFY